MDGGQTPTIRTTRAMSRAASVQTVRPVPGTPPVPPPTPRRSSIWQLSRRAGEAEEEAAAAAAVSPAPYVQAFPQVTAIPLTAEDPPKLLSTSPRRPRSRPLEQPKYRVREAPGSEVATTPTSSGPVLPTPPSTIESIEADTAPADPAPWSTADSDPAPSAPAPPSPVEDIDVFAASAIQIGIDEWIVSEQRRQIAADAAALHNLDVVQNQTADPDARVPVQHSATTQTVEPASVLDSEWLFERQNISLNSGLGFAHPDDFNGILGPSLETITCAYLADQDSFDALPASVLSNRPNDIWNPFQSNFECLFPIPATLDPSHLSLPFSPQTQTQQAPTTPVTSYTASPYHVSTLCIDPSCSITHPHEQGLYVARPERPRTWNVCWGYSDPPEEIWEALTAMAQGRAVQRERDVVLGFSACHFWDGGVQGFGGCGRGARGV